MTINFEYASRSMRAAKHHHRARIFMVGDTGAGRGKIRIWRRLPVI